MDSREAIEAAIECIKRGHYTLAMKELEAALAQHAESAEPDAVVQIDRVGRMTIHPILRPKKELRDGQKLFSLWCKIG